MRRIGKLFFDTRTGLRQITQLLLPALSPITGEVVSSTGALAPEDWQQLEFLGTQVCDCCGTPLTQMALPGTNCVRCETDDRLIHRTRSALVYNEMSKRLILNFKHGGRADSIDVFSDWMIHSGVDLLQSPAVLVPVPLHWAQRRHRKFNQSALLARAIARRTQMDHRPQWLVRHRNTPSQGFKSGAKRTKNVKGAFAVPDRFRDDVNGKHIVLIDDVHTSGSTVKACADTLLKAGAAQIEAVTLARVVKPVEVIT